MKTNIQIMCVDQTLQVLNEPVIACGGANEDTVTFQFCQMWADMARTAVFYWSKDANPQKEPEEIFEIVLSNDSCIIPAEVLSSEGYLFIGVRGVVDDVVIRTSEMIRYKITKGAPRGTNTAAEPTADIYEQILLTAVSAENIAKNAEEIAQSVRDDADAGVFDGVSVTHEWDGTILKVTSASGTTSADLKGDKGDQGEKGDKGDQGEKGDKGDTGEVDPSVMSQYLPLTGGTMTGILNAARNTSYSTAQVRNIYVVEEGTTLPSSSSGNNGDICLVYTP